MEGFTLVLALAARPAAGNFLGGIAAELFKVSERTLSLALHLAAGIVLAVVGLELMPEALRADAPWVPILAFVGGGAFFLGIERAIGFIKDRVESSDRATGPMAICEHLAPVEHWLAARSGTEQGLVCTIHHDGVIGYLPDEGP